MASSEGQQEPPVKSPFNLFRGISWTSGRKKAKQANLGEENNMYYHPELKRWVERGKEDEAERDAAGPPPPPVLSAGSKTSTPLSKRSLSQRYVLQPNLSVSSSMASLAGSVSQPDLVGLAAGFNDSFSGPPSTSPSPPQSSNSLIPPATFASAPSSGTGASGLSPAAFFIPSPRQQATPTPPGTFFMPFPQLRTAEPSTPDDPLAESRSSMSGATWSSTKPNAAAEATTATAAAPDSDSTSTQAAPPAHQGVLATDGQSRGPEAETFVGGSSIGTLEDGDAAPGTALVNAAPALSALGGGAAGELSLRNSLASASLGTEVGGRVHSAGVPSASVLSLTSLTSEDPGVLSFPSPLGRNADSPAALRVASHSLTEEEEPPLQLPCSLQPQPLPARDYRRLGGSAANASDGGAAISLHEGMGFTPVRAHGVGHSAGQDGTAAVDGGVLTVEEVEEETAVEGGVGESCPAPEAVGDGETVAEEAVERMPNGAGLLVVAGGDVDGTAGVADGVATAAAATAASVGDAAVATAADSSALYSQYYYQQYAYLYQYALEQGYAETDAVSYAQYYAAMYAQQYEAQAPEGRIGGCTSTAVVDGEGDGTAGAVQDQPSVAAGEEAVAVDGQASVAVVAAAEAVEHGVEPAWQAAAAAVEDEAPAAVRSGGGADVSPAEAGHDVSRGQDPLYLQMAPAPHVALPGLPLAVGPSASDAVMGAEAAADAVPIAAAPLPADLTAAATAAAHHHQSAVTAAVAVAAAAVEQHQLLQQQRASGLGAGDGSSRTLAGAEHAIAAQPATATVAATAPQLLLGLGAAGAKRITKLSSAATAAVASLGASVTATAPLAAALSAAAAAASTAAAAASAAGGLAGLDAVRGLSEDDFERIMHPGDPAKLDGPLPWELPEHLRTGRKFLALCANWQLANPGQPYAPHLLLQQQEQQPQQQQQQEPSPPPPQELEVIAAREGDVALAAEGGSGSVGGAAQQAQSRPHQQEPAVEEDMSSYERACRLSQFGQPVAVLLPNREAKQPAAGRGSVGGPQPPPPQGDKLPPPPPPEQQQPIEAKPLTERSCDVSVVASALSSEPALGGAEETSAKPDSAVSAPAAAAAVRLDLGLLPAVDSPREPMERGSARSDDPFAGIQPVPVTQQLQLQQPGPQYTPDPLPYGGVTLEQVLEQERRSEAVVPTEALSFERLATVEAANFFEQLGEQVQTPVAAKPEAAEDTAGCTAMPSPEHAEGAAAASPELVEEDGVLDAAAAAPAATAAAAAIDSVVQALEQLRSNAAAGSGGVAEDPSAGTALLLQIQSSLAQATEALAGMGVDVSALASLAAVPAAQNPTTLLEWTPSAGHKRARVDTSPATPTRVAGGGAATESVATPVLPPGPLVVRPAPEEAEGTAATSAIAPAERFHQLGRRLSDASAEAVAQSSEAEARQPPLPQQQQWQQQPVVVSLTISALPEVDVAAVEERVRGEERAAWEARLGEVVDSEREAAALVIAAVERKRDGLQQRTGELEQALAAATAERDGLLQRLEGAEADCSKAHSARAAAETERAALATRLSEVTAERDALTAALVVERSEKEALAEALASARAESEELRQRYAERFSALSSELEATRGSLTALQGEHDELLLCLGQESTKVAVLTDALRDAGGDPEPLIEQIEAEYETMGLGGEREADEVEGALQVAVEGKGQQRAGGVAVGEGEAADELLGDGAGEGWESEDLEL